jgi:hypothetical protein
MRISSPMRWFIRLLLAAVILAIAGISALFLALTWSAPSPLYFRVVEERAAPSGLQGRVLLVEVRNASDASIIVTGSHLTRVPVSPGDGYIQVSSAFLSEQVTPPAYAPGSTPSPRAIPARGKVYYLASLDADTRVTFDRGRFELSYTYLTSSQRRAQRLLGKVAPYLPKRFADELPSIRESYDQATLDVSVLRTPSRRTSS